LQRENDRVLRGGPTSMRRREYFEITKYARRFDQSTGKFVIDVAYETATEITPRTIAVSEAFGLGVDQHQKFMIYDNVELKISPKDIVYITGDSGSGKSVLLRTLMKDIQEEPSLGGVISIADIDVDPDKPLIDTVGKTVEEGLELLSRVGLNDAFLFVRRYKELSDGQRYRYRIAKLMESGAQWWILDEFAATLDRDTARIVAFNLQKLARQNGKAVLAATTHKDLFDDLAPSVHIHKRYGKEITVNYYPDEPAKECSLAKEITVREGNKRDYETLAEFHYRGHNIGVPRKIFCAMRGEELCGVVVYTYPAAATSGRRNVLGKMAFSELNRSLCNIMRVIVHPKYRTVGLGQKLIRETYFRCGTPYVETTAVMAKYNPFFEKAGLIKVQEVTPSKQALAIKDVLEKMHFNITLLGSHAYVLTKLQSLTESELRTLRQALIMNAHPRFLKEFFSHQPYGKRQLFEKAVEIAGLEKLAKLLKVTGMLLQTKVYLFWKNEPALAFMQFLNENTQN